MTINKVIFLDVDGVLNRCGTWNVLTLPQPHQTLPLVTEANIVNVLNHIMEQRNDIAFVISSTWRKIADNAEHFSELTGIDLAHIHKDWRTSHYGDRGDQCMEWLYRHPEVVQHVVIDDNDYNFDEYEGKLNVVKTKEDEGLSYANLEDAFEYLGFELDRRYILRETNVS